MKWKTKTKVEDAIRDIINDYQDREGAPGLEKMAIKLRDLAMTIHTDMSAEITQLRSDIQAVLNHPLASTGVRVWKEVAAEDPDLIQRLTK